MPHDVQTEKWEEQVQVRPQGSLSQGLEILQGSDSTAMSTSGLLGPPQR